MQPRAAESSDTERTYELPGAPSATPLMAVATTTAVLGTAKGDLYFTSVTGETLHVISKGLVHMRSVARLVEHDTRRAESHSQFHDASAFSLDQLAQDSKLCRRLVGVSYSLGSSSDEKSLAALAASQLEKHKRLYPNCVRPRSSATPARRCKWTIMVHCVKGRKRRRSKSTKHNQ